MFEKVKYDSQTLILVQSVCAVKFPIVEIKDRLMTAGLDWDLLSDGCI